MSARGARSRKVQQKDIVKKELKTTGKGKGPDPIYEASENGYAEWQPSPNIRHPQTGVTRTLTTSSNNSRTTSRSSEGSGRPKGSALQSHGSFDIRQSSSRGPGSVSDVSSKGKEKATFQAKGKETKAPRGRGGGVPIKKAVASSPAPPMFRSETAASSNTTHQKTWTNFKVWEGGRDSLRPYNGFKFDDDMQNGSVQIYFNEEQTDEDRPLPNIRAELEVLENAGSTWLTNALIMGRIDDDDGEDWGLPSSPGPSEYSSPNFAQAERRRMLSPTSPAGRSPPALDIDQHYGGLDPRANSRMQHLSEATRLGRSNSSAAFQRNRFCSPTHQIWFPAPSEIKSPQGQRLHHVAIRNFFAMLHGKSIVGSNTFDMLDTLHSSILVMYDLDHDERSRLTPQARSVQLITNYLGQHGIDDIRNNVRQALALLAWSEKENVKWRQGYLESYVHLAGVMTPQMEDLTDFKRLSVVTRRNLGLSGKTLQLRVMEAEEKLSGFDFADLWGDTSNFANSPVYQAYQSFRQFLISHYTRIHGSWPPQSNGTWLNRKIARTMQEDFGSLYDYLVDRDVIWNPREERASRKWEMAHRKQDSFKADLPELGITDMLVMFDAKQGFSHIPHPYPLLPGEVPKVNKEKEKKSFFSSLKKDKSKDTTKDAKAHLQLSIVFSDATNIEKLDVNFNGSTLIDKFEQFELTTDLKHTTPREARLGRWVLLYGVLQVLSTLSTDVRGLKHTDGVRSFLCTDLKRLPEWVTNGQIEHLEASQERSWCWQRAWDPMPAQNAPVELEAPLVNDRNPAPTQDTRSRDVDLFGHSFPSPPPERSLPPPPPSFDGATLMQNDIRRIGEKIDNMSLSHNATNLMRQDMERRRENEKSVQSEFSDRKPPLSAPVPNTAAFRAPSRLESLPRRTDDSTGRSSSHHGHGNSDDAYRLTESDFRDRQLRSHVASVNTIGTDLDGYPFSQNDMQWPVPPRYVEQNYRESTVLGGGFEDWTIGGDRAEVGGRDDRRSPRRVEEGGWQ